MGDAGDIIPPSRKRAAGRELSRENPGLDDEDEACDLETGSFKIVSDDVLANNEAETEKIVSENVNKETEKAEDDNDKEKSDTVKGSKPELSDDKTTVQDKTENEDSKETNGATAAVDAKKDNGIDKCAEAGSLSSFHQLSSSKNAFTGLSGTGFSSSSFSFGLIPKEGSPLDPCPGSGPNSSSSSFFGLKTDQPSSFSLSNNKNASLFGTTGASISTKSEASGPLSMQKVHVETGEESEKSVFIADSMLFEFAEGGWRERGKGELKVNVSINRTGKARLLMRTRGNYRLILNASLYSDMKLANMEKRGITFACMNSAGEGKDTLSTFALKFKDASVVEEFREAVTEYKGKTAANLKTPENSP